jgi:hypothetical protein
VPKEGSLDLREFHRAHGRQTIACYLVLNLVSLVYGAIYGYFYHVPEQFAQNAMILSFLAIALAAWIGRKDYLQNICAGALLLAYPLYFYVGQQPLQ